MASVSHVLLLVACFLALNVIRGRDIVAVDDRKLTPSFKSGPEAEANAPTFETSHLRMSVPRIQSRFISRDIQKVRTEDSGEVAGSTREMKESSDGKPRERSLIGTIDKSRSLLGSVLWHILRKRQSKIEEFSAAFDSDYCQPTTHPPSNN